jgi:hypothetical protein
MSRQIATSPFSLPKVHICLTFLFCLAYFLPGLGKATEKFSQRGSGNWKGSLGWPRRILTILSEALGLHSVCLSLTSLDPFIER